MSNINVQMTGSSTMLGAYILFKTEEILYDTTSFINKIDSVQFFSLLLFPLFHRTVCLDAKVSLIK